MAKPALGRGLAALLGGSPPEAKTPPVPIQPAHVMTAVPVLDARERVERAPLTRIRPCPLQPRKDFSEEALRELADSMIAIFARDQSGRRPVYGDTSVFQTDPHWRDLLLFYEYFHAENGAGLGASHQTGWTALVASLIDEWRQ